ncbi:MAG: flotillin family protein, partial [Clostridia bacterium]|nr:flotillin family protein [Clostridia bacterium]
ELTKIQVEAIKNLQIDKITVWDSMSGEGGAPTTANFLSGMMKSIPPLNETMKMAGIQMPEFLGKEIAAPEVKAE